MEFHYQVETLPDGWIAIWRTSLDNRVVYSVTEIPPGSRPPAPTDPLVILLQAMAEVDDVNQ